jgi:hypothetical protein
MIISLITAAIGAVTKYFKEKSASRTRKTFNRLTTQDSSTWNITHNTGSTAVWNWKPERWGLRLVQLERYQEEKGCNKRHNNNNNNNNCNYKAKVISSHSRPVVPQNHQYQNKHQNKNNTTNHRQDLNSMASLDKTLTNSVTTNTYGHGNL